MKALRIWVCATMAALLPLAAQTVPPITMELIGRYSTGVFDDGGAEIPAYDKDTKRLFVVNAGAGDVEILDLTNPSSPVKIGTLATNTAFPGSSPNSVAVANGLVAVAVQAGTKTDNGRILVYTANGTFLRAFEAGALPDMVTFTPDGRTILSANEGEPNDDYSVDPVGSVTIVNLPASGTDLASAQVTTVGFEGFRREDLDARIRIYGPNASVAQDLEPEYIAVSPDGTLAYVTLQENNALGILDLRSRRFTAVLSLGFKDHRKFGNGLDGSDRDNGINIANWPVFGMYQPDGIASFSDRGEVFLITANEGDAREYDTFEEEVRVGSSSVVLSASAFPDTVALKRNENIGRLTITNTLGRNSSGRYSALYVLGGRSFSIWQASSGRLIYDSGDDFEQITGARYPEYFNTSNDDNDSTDSRSDNKGPEPEDVKVAELFGRRYAFIGLERIGGVMIYDITNPYLPTYVDYVNSRDFSGDAEAGTAGDLGPEGLVFIPAADSPNQKPLLVVANEVSGTVAVFEIKQRN